MTSYSALRSIRTTDAKSSVAQVETLVAILPELERIYADADAEDAGPFVLRIERLITNVRNHIATTIAANPPTPIPEETPESACHPQAR